MLRWTALVAGCLLWGAATLHAEDEGPLTRFSSDAAVVVRLAAPEKTIGQVADLVDAIQPGFGDQVRQQGDMIGVAISNPTLAGVDKTEDWYLIVFADADGPPTAIFAIPATDPKALAEALPENLESEIDGDWVYYTDKNQGLPEKLTKDDESIEEGMGDEAGKLFDKGDLAIYVNVEDLAETYKAQLEEVQAKAKEAIENLPNQLGPQGEQIKPAMAMYSELLDKLMVAVGDGEELTIALNIDKTGLTIEDYGVFGEDSETAKAIAAHPVSKMAMLGKLPPSAIGYVGVSADLRKLMQWGLKYSTEMLKDESQKEALNKSIEGMKGIAFSGMVNSFDIGDTKSGLFKMVGVAECTPVDKLKAQMRSISKSMGKIEYPGFSQETTVKEDAETIAGQKVDLITIKQEVEDQNAAMIQTAMFGPDGMTSRVAYLDKGYIQTMGGGKGAMEAALKTYKATSSASAATAFQAKLLPASNLTWMLDLPTLAIRAAKVAGDFGAQLPFEASELDGLEVTPSFMGGAVAVEKNAVRAKFTLPVEQAQNIAKLVMFGIQKQQGR